MAELSLFGPAEGFVYAIPTNVSTVRVTCYVLLRLAIGSGEWGVGRWEWGGGSGEVGVGRWLGRNGRGVHTH